MFWREFTLLVESSPQSANKTLIPTQEHMSHAARWNLFPSTWKRIPSYSSQRVSFETLPELAPSSRIANFGHCSAFPRRFVHWSGISSDLLVPEVRAHRTYSGPSFFFLRSMIASTFTLSSAEPMKTFRKWSWMFVELIADLNVVSSVVSQSKADEWPHLLNFNWPTWVQIVWNKRLDGSLFDGCRVSVDGTDFPIFEPKPFNPKWFSHKFKGPGLRYEIAFCIETGKIVWVHGPFPCGAYPDLKIFRMALKLALSDSERTVADGTYNDDAA